MDVVYPLGKGSTWKDLEIRYSLRSVERHLQDAGNIYIIGQCPDFLTNVYHLPWPDPHACKERNIMEKIQVACRIKALTEDFLFFNDDFFLLAILSPNKLPFFYQDDLPAALKRYDEANTYRLSLQNTETALKAAGLPNLHYDIHCPIIYNKRYFPEIMERFNWDKHHGYTIKSLYANSLNVESVPLIDPKIATALKEPEIARFTSTKKFFSTGPCGINRDMESFLQKMFPEKSRFEA